MLRYVIIALIALWVIIFIWVRILRRRAKRPAAQAEIGPPPPELVEIHVQFKGTERSAIMPEPDGDEPKPLLLCFHGGLGNPERFAETTDLAARAQAWGFFPVFPGAPEGWVDGRPERGTGTEDLDFVEALIKRLAQDATIDPARVFAIGVSNGGFFVQHLATQRPGVLVGGAAVLASIPAAVADSTRQGSPLPFMLACDPGDTIMPFAGGEIASLPGVGVGGWVVPVPEARAIWVERNGAQTSSRQRRIAGPDGFWNDVYDHPAGASGAPVRFVEVHGAGHRWPRWPGAGKIPTVNIADTALEFFVSAAVRDFAARSEQQTAKGH